jgi:hypothetical protein
MNIHHPQIRYGIPLSVNSPVPEKYATTATIGWGHGSGDQVGPQILFMFAPCFYVGDI